MLRESKWCVLPQIRLTNLSVTPPPFFSNFNPDFLFRSNKSYILSSYPVNKGEVFPVRICSVYRYWTFLLFDWYIFKELNRTHLHLNLPSCSFIPQKWIKWFWIKWMRRFCKRLIFIVCGGPFRPKACNIGVQQCFTPRFHFPATKYTPAKQHN